MKLQHNWVRHFLALISLLLVCVMLFASCAPTINQVVETSKATDNKPTEDTSNLDHDHDHDHDDETDHIHTWSSWETINEPTCTTNGSEIKFCPCGENVVKIIDALGHDYISVTTAPTCTEKGYTTHTCAVCKYSYIYKYVEASGHNYSAVVTDPSCSEKGYTTYTCSCGDSYVDNYVNATGHTFGDWTTTKEATCTEKGEKKRECACGEVETETIPATSHSYTTVVTAPTCTERGYTTYTCECGDSYIDNYVSATGHSFGDWKATKEATCTEKGEQKRECACGVYETKVIPATDHSYKSVVTEPTCEDKGYTTYTCHCGDSYVDDYVDANGHSYKSVTTAPTCTERGYTTHTCHCGDSYIDTYLDAKGHKDDGTGVCSVCGNSCDHFHTYTLEIAADKYLASAATCTAPATYYYSCTCGASGTETFESGNALGHTYTSVVTAPTCTERGYTTHTCHCGDSYVDTPVDATGHSYKSVITAPTCTERGYTTHTCHCGDSYIDTYVDAKGHKDDGTGTCSVCGSSCDHSHTYTLEIVADKYLASAATCTAPATYYYSCTCGASGTEAFESGNALGHTYTSVVTAPTCTKNGYTTHSCHCGDSYTDSFVDATGHNYNSVVTAPTCTERGYTTHTCHCGDSYVDTYVDATNHTDNGFGICSVCGSKCDHYHSYTIKKATDDYLLSKANCMAPAIYFYSCTCGAIGSETFEDGAALGHNRIYSTTPATCTENGYSYVTCSNCDYETMEVVYATGHVITDYYIYDKPTCTVDGSYSGYCDNCNEYIEGTLDATGHTASEFYFADDYCGEQKLGYILCVDCEILLAEFGHSYKETIVKASCTENGKKVYTCEHCSNSYEITIPATGHVAGEWTVITPAGCTTEGEKGRYCVTCNTIVESISISANGHSYESSATNRGVTYKCANCDDSYFVETVEYITLTFICDGEKICKDLQITKGSTPTLPLPTRDNYTFSGWYLDEELTNKCLDSYEFTADTTLYSTWMESGISGEASTNNLFTDVATDFTFTVTSDVALTNDNLSSYVFVTDLAKESPAIYIVSEANGVYTIGSKNYKPRMTYQVLLREGVEFTDTSEKTIWFAVAGENVYDIQFKEGVVFIPQLMVYDLYESADKTYLLLTRDDLNKGDNTVIFKSAKDDIVTILEVVSEMPFGNLYLYQVKQAELTNIFTNFEFYSSDALNVEGFELDSTATEELTQQLMASPVYAQFKQAAFMMRGVEIGDYYYDFNGFDGPNWNKECKDNKITIKATVTANFARMHVDTRKVDSTFTITMEFENVLTFDEDSSIQRPNWYEFWKPTYFSFIVNISNNTKVNFFASINDKKNVTTELYYFKKAFDNAKNSGSFPVTDSSSASINNLENDQKEIKLGSLTVPVGPLTFTVELKNTFNFEAVGKLGVGFESNIDLKMGVKGDTSGNFETISDYDYYASIDFYMLGKVSVSDILTAKVSLSLWGILGVNADASLGLYFEMGGIISVHLDNRGNNSKVAGGYLELGLIIDVNIGIDILIWHPTWNLYNEKKPIISLGDKEVPLYFEYPKQELRCSIPCGKSINVSELIDTSAVVQNFENMKKESKDLTCEYYLNGSYSGIRLSTDGTLRVSGDKQGLPISIKVVCGDIYKIVTLTISVSHNKVTSAYVAPTCTNPGNTEYVYCSTCYKVCEGENTVIDPLGHSYIAVITDPTCTEKGYTTHTCSNCDDVYVDSYISATGHSYGEWYITMEPTCVNDGIRQHDCINCDHYETQSIDATGHTYTSVVTAPTCTEKGYTTHTCHCEYIYIDEYVVATGHNYESVVTDPTCTERGYTTHTCSACEDSYVDTYVVANNHTDNGRGICSVCGSECDHFHNYIVENTADTYLASAATCTTPTKYYYSCTCDAIGTETFEFGEPLGHNHVIDEAIAPTCSKTGLSEGQHCSICGEVIVAQKVVDKVPHTDNGYGICSVCGELFNHTHSYTIKNLTEEYLASSATCFAPAKYYYSCVCGAKGSTTFYGGDFHTRVDSNGDEICDICYVAAGLYDANGNLVASWDTLVNTYGMNATNNYKEPNSLVPYNTKSPCYILNNKTELSKGTHLVLGKINYIGDYAFWHTKLTNIIIPNSVTSIGNGAFDGCTQLTNMNIPYGVTSIGKEAFYNCYSMTSVTIPDSVTSIGWGAFDQFNKTWKLSSVHISDIEAWCNISFEAASANPLTYAHNLYINGKLVTEIVIPNTIVQINDYVFSGCSLTKITIPDSVTSIGARAFATCSLTKISIPDSVTSIGNSAFSECTNLTSITIPDSVTSIGDYVFYKCSSLTSITVPDSVTSIGSCAFKYCNSLTSITIPFVGATKSGTTNTHFGYIFGASSLSDQGSYISPLLKTVIITGETKIYNNAFVNCSRLTSITIPNSVTSIGNYVFNSCSRLTSIAFKGTVSEWNAITKGTNWNYKVPATKVICSDGTVSLS